MKLSRRHLAAGVLALAAETTGCQSSTPTKVQGVSVSQSAVSVSAGTVASGATAVLTLQAKDDNGANLTTGGLTVAFTVSGGTSTGTVGATTDHADGSYSAVFTGVTAGTATTVHATIGGAAVTSNLPTLTVTAGAASPSQSVVSVSAATVASAATATLTLQARDAAGNGLTAGGLTVTFSTSGGTSTGTIGATTDHGDGSYTAVFTGTTAGTATTIHATMGGVAVTSTLPTITVTPGGASTSQSTVSVSAGTVASGATVTLTLQAKDASGANLTSGGLAVGFTASGGSSTGAIGATTDHGDGTYTAVFTGATAGSATTVHATIGGAAVTSTLPTITVTPGAASTSRSTVAVSAASVASGSTATLTLQAKDAAGNSLTTGGLTVAFTASGGTSTGAIGATTDHTNGTYTAVFTGMTAGTATTVHATIGGVAVTSTLPTIAVTPGPASTSQSIVSVSAATVASGGTVALTLQAKDAAGNNLTTGGLAVAFSASGGTSTGTIGATTDEANGAYTATFTAGTAGTATTINATIGGVPVTSTLPTVTVTAASASECGATQPAAWIWCDDFEQNRLASYFEYDSANGDFMRVAGVGVNGSYGMRARWSTVGQSSAGSLHLAFGKTPSSYFKPVDAGTQNYRDIFWRMWVRLQSGWTGGGADKLSRATVFANANWAQAMAAHVWSGMSPDENYLLLDPASGTDSAGALQTTQYNDVNNFRWFGAVRGNTALFATAQAGNWFCVEAHAKLNDAGQSNGVFELWINGTLDAQATNLNWLGSFSAYGINAIFFENFWNAGAPQVEERYFDGIVVSTQRIGC